jgi:hypothetical protein
VPADVGGVLEHRAALLGPLHHELLHRALADDRVAIAVQTDLEQQIDQVAPADSRAIQQIFTFARAIQSARDTDLVVPHRELVCAVVEQQRDLGQAKPRATLRTGEDDLFSSFPT